MAYTGWKEKQKAAVAVLSWEVQQAVLTQPASIKILSIIHEVWKPRGLANKKGKNPPNYPSESDGYAGPEGPVWRALWVSNGWRWQRR